MGNEEPLVRSKELAPLSREHHDGLLFVWKLRQGLKYNIAAARLKGFVIFYWQQHIKPHFYHEEQVLSKHIPADNPLIRQMNEEHALIRELILSLGEDTTVENFTTLADVIYKHIRFEERELLCILVETAPRRVISLTIIHTCIVREPELACCITKGII